MRRLAVIAALAAAAVWIGASAPAGARSLQEDSQSEVAKKKKHRDGGTRDDEEKEEDLRRSLPGSVFIHGH